MCVVLFSIFGKNPAHFEQNNTCLAPQYYKSKIFMYPTNSSLSRQIVEYAPHKWKETKDGNGKNPCRYRLRRPISVRKKIKTHVRARYPPRVGNGTRTRHPRYPMPVGTPICPHASAPGVRSARGRGPRHGRAGHGVSSAGAWWGSHVVHR